MSELINSKSMFSEERVSEIKEIQRDISVKRLKKKKTYQTALRWWYLLELKMRGERKQGRKMSRNNGKKSLNLVKTKTYVSKILKAPQWVIYKDNNS